MTPTDEPLIPDQQLDALLRHALLGKETMFNEQTLSLMAHEAFAADIAIAAGKEKSLIEKLTRDFRTTKFNYRLNALWFLLLGGTILAAIFLSSPGKTVGTVSPSAPQPPQEEALAGPVANISAEQLTSNPTPRINPVIAALFDSLRLVEPPQEDDYVPLVASPSNATKLHLPKDDYAYEEVPTLTPAQTRQTAKDKLKIVRLAVKKHEYSRVRMGGVTSVSGTLSGTIMGFSIKSSEVSNFEYRTFLNDLLVQGRHEDYLAAKPVKGNWTKIGLPEFENVYDESERYNDFPVVNITRKGAELYCEWLTAAMRSAIEKKEVKWSESYMPTFRLPFNVEWIYAARGCDTTIQTPWEKVAGPGLQNKRGCFMCNFNYGISKDKVKPLGPENNNDGKSKQGCISPKTPRWPIVTTAGKAIDTLLTAPVWSYNPNSIGAYNMLGNVSEMVWTTNSDNTKGEARSMGGNWYSHYDNVLIEAPEQYVGVTEAQPYIGFRPLMTWQ